MRSKALPHSEDAAMPTNRARVLLLSLLIILSAGCGGGGGSPGTPGTPFPPAPVTPPPVVTGVLALVISNLPTGTLAVVRVTGPGNFSLDVTQSQAIANLTPGTYIVTASPVSSGGTVYNPSPATQNITVTGGATANAVVGYIVGGPTGFLSHRPGQKIFRPPIQQG
jgi:hypothetical protein